jgi:bifunctional ADP-heptose synthase (sugar kinase/adenylyltransferase)
MLLERAISLVAAFPHATVLGIGDLILDQYRRGKAIGLSPEAPVVELLNPGLVETPGV